VPFDRSVYLPLDAQGSIGAMASGIAFATSTGDVLEVSAYGPGTFRLRVGPDSKPDYDIVDGHPQPCAVSKVRDATWLLTAGDTSLEIAEAPLALKLRHHDRDVLASATDLQQDGSPRMPTVSRLRRGAQWTAAFALASGEPVYGFGEQFGALNKRGQFVQSWVEDAHGVNTGRAHKAAPFAWSPGSGAASQRGAWGLFVHTPGRVVHAVGSPDWSHRSYAIVVDDEALDLFFFAADTPADILERYTRITGRAPTVPLWSLGVWIARDRHDTLDDARALAARWRERDFPGDVLTIDDCRDWETAIGADPDVADAHDEPPPEALARIRALDFRVGVAESPYVANDSPLFSELAARGYLLMRDERPCTCMVDPAADSEGWDGASPLPQEFGFVDFTQAAAYAWWRDAHAKLYAGGVDVVTTDGGELVPEDATAANGDGGERLHNVYPLLYARCAFEAATKFRPAADALPLIVSRAGWAGSHRYPVQRGGEPQTDWEGLAAAIRGALSWGMSGAPYHAADVGGSYGGALSSELYVRWLQAAIFASHVRVPGMDGREPWSFGADIEAIAKKWLSFRYRLLPYLQRACAQSARTGLPVMRAMPLAFPSNALVRQYDTQFMCGDALLVAPILAPDGDVEIALPPGAWYDLNTRARFPGLRVLRYRAPLDRFPVFGREGYTLPLGPAVGHTGETDPLRPLASLWVFGAPTELLAGFVQASIGAGPDGVMIVDADPELGVEMFGEVAAGKLVRRERAIESPAP
jgi:alpha-D-xyloside xylohydrolase